MLIDTKLNIGNIVYAALPEQVQDKLYTSLPKLWKPIEVVVKEMNIGIYNTGSIRIFCDVSYQGDIIKDLDTTILFKTIPEAQHLCDSCNKAIKGTKIEIKD